MGVKFLFIIIFLITLNACYSQSCKLFSSNGWHIVYNKFYNKYAVVRIDSSMIGTSYEREFLVKDHYGRYGVYGDGWMDCSGYNDCGDKSKSLFTNPCDAKKYLQTYIKKLKTDNW